MENQNRCISCGKCNKKYSLLILGVILILGVLIGVMFGFSSYAKSVNINDKILLNFMTYAFFVNLGESLMIIPELILKREISLDNYNSNTKHVNIIDKRSYKYIFNKKINFSLKENIYFYSAGILKLFLDTFHIVYQVKIDDFTDESIDFIKMMTYSFQFELLFLFLLSKIMYNTQFYKHQYISIIILTLLGLAKFIVKNSGNMEKFFLRFFIHIGYSFFKSLITVYIKGLMEYKYFSPYKACYKFGIVNVIIMTILNIGASFFPCDSFSCQVTFNKKRYFANILAIFSIPGLFMFIIFILKAITLVLEYNIILNFTVCHSFLIIQLTQFLEASSIKMMGDSKAYLAITLINFVLSIFLIFLFLEIIEINIFKISHNTKTNIEMRGITDSTVLLTINEENNFNEEEEVEKERNDSIH